MADRDFFNKSFVQQGKICAMVSYGTVIEYFSDNNYTIDNVLDKYIAEFNIQIFSYSKNIQAKKHDSIFKAFHKYCKDNGDIRGFEFIKHMHKNNKLDTKRFCKIVGFNALQQKISDQELDLIRKELVDNEAVAMVLYKVDDKNLHAVTIGFDVETGTYFYKDPEKNKIGNGDILSRIEIWEYIIFNDLE